MTYNITIITIITIVCTKWIIGSVPLQKCDFSLLLGGPVTVDWDGEEYTGKVVKVEEGKVLIHFDGWAKKYDEWVTCKTSLTTTVKREVFKPVTSNILDPEVKVKGQEVKVRRRSGRRADSNENLADKGRHQ